MTPAGARRLNGCAYVVFAVLAAFFGCGFLLAGSSLGPQDRDAANVFRTDPSCAAAALDAGGRTRAVPAGNCTIVGATVVYAVTRVSNNFSRTHAHTPVVEVRYADGSSHQAELDGSAGGIFVDVVHAGAAARVQLYRGTFARIAADGASAETSSAPDVGAKTDTQMLWVGGAMLAFAAFILVMGYRSGRRAAAAS